MGLHGYIRILRINWILILAAAILGGMVGGVVAMATPTRYEASADLYVSVRPETGSPGELRQSGEYARQAIVTYREIIRTEAVLAPAAAQIDGGATVQELAERVEATSPAATQMLTVSAVDEDPARAAEIANAVAASFIDVASAQIDGFAAPDPESRLTLTVMQPAEEPTTPSGVNMLLAVVLGVLAGGLLAFAGASIRTALDTRIRSVADASEVAAAHVIGVVPDVRDSSALPLVVDAQSDGAVRESLRSLRTNVAALHATRGVALVFIGSGEGVGTTTVLVNLAISLSRSGHSVAVVDANLRAPAAGIYLGVESQVGVADVIGGRLELADGLVRWKDSGLYLMPPGDSAADAHVIDTPETGRMIRSLREHFDFVLIDAPPATAVADAMVLAHASDGVVIVTAAGQSRKSELRRTAEAAELARVDVRGLVVTRVPRSGPDRYPFGSYRAREDTRLARVRRNS